MVGAWEPELTRLRELAPALLDRPGPTVVLDVVGIGVIDASIGMTQCIERHRPTDVVFIGTCGTLRGLDVGAAIVVRSTVLVDGAVSEGRAVSLSPLVCNLQPTILATMLVANGAREATVANTIGVTTDDDLAAALAEAHDVEHLEAFGVARACAAMHVPCTILLGVTNAVGRGGSEAWKQNHVRVSAHIGERLCEALRTSRAERSPERS